MNAIDVAAVAGNYDRMAERLIADARKADARGQSRAARDLRRQALIAHHAAREELRDTEPADVQVRIVVPDTFVTSPVVPVPEAAPNHGLVDVVVWWTPRCGFLHVETNPKSISAHCPSIAVSEPAPRHGPTA